MSGVAEFDRHSIYRYRLTRTWDGSGSAVLWVMLNPSTATASTDDHTIRRVIDFSRRWGHGTAEVVNLFALRSQEPGALTGPTDPVGADNDRTIAEALSSANRVVIAWGNRGTLPNPRTGVPRSAEVEGLIGEARRPVDCLGFTARGHPRHPLYVRADTEPTVFH